MYIYVSKYTQVYKYCRSRLAQFSIECHGIQFIRAAGVKMHVSTGLEFFGACKCQVTHSALDFWQSQAKSMGPDVLKTITADE